MRTSHDPTFPLFPTFAFLGFVLSLIPLPWHIQAWNSGTCAFMLWTATACFISFVNSIIWVGNINNPAPVWCDISSKLILGVSIGIPAATLCISRRLYYLTSGNTVSITHEDKRRMVIVDVCIAVGIPAIIMILHYVVQGHRFDILEDIGCQPVVYNTLPAYFLYFMWPVLLGAVSFVFSALTLRSFWIRRAQFNQLINSSSSMSVSRYLRLVFLALIDMMCTVPLGIYSIYIGNQGVGLAPWISWDDTHFNFSRVALVPSLIWRSDPSFQTSVELTRWLPVLCAFLFFGMFGFAEEAKKHYKSAFWTVLKPFGVRPRPSVSISSMSKGSNNYMWNKPSKGVSLPSNSSVGSLPVYAPKSHTSPTSTSFASPTRKHHRSQSFSSSASTHADIEYELGTYKHTTASPDIEKSAGLSPVLSDSDAATLYNDLPVYHIRRKPAHVFEDIRSTADNDMALPSPSICNSGRFEHHQLSSALSEPTLTFAPVVHHPKPQTSYSSMRTITSPDRDRFYISPAPLAGELNSERARTPPSPAPFVSSTIPVEDEYIPGRNVIQVMVHTTETTTLCDRI